MRFLDRGFGINRTWVAVGAATIGAAGAVGGAAISANSNGGKPGIEDNYIPGPNSSTSTGVENTWADFLNSANAGNNYNAISPDWNDIWQQTQQQVQQYYNGTATNPGVNDQINASFAQRGMSGDPAASFLQAQSGANEASTLGGLSAQQNIAKQQFAQQGQSNWLNSLNQFQNASGNTQAEGTWTGAQPYATPGQQIGNAITAAGTGAIGLATQANSNQNQLNYLNQMYASGLPGYGTTGVYAPAGSTTTVL